MSNNTLKIHSNTIMNKMVRLTEQDLHNIVKESVKKILREAQLNELDPRTYSSYASGREAQMKQAAQNGDSDAEFNYMRKRNAGEQAAMDKWNELYSHDSNGTGPNYSMQYMGDTKGYNFSNNMGSKYGINYQSSNIGFDGKRKYYNYAYNPKTNMEWRGNGDGTTGETKEHRFDTGDNGAHRVAREMELGNGKYIKGKGWQ